MSLHDLPSSASLVPRKFAIAASFAYWLGWLCLGLWSQRQDGYYMVQGWWMALSALWLTAGYVIPADKLRQKTRSAFIVLVAVTAAVLIRATVLWSIDLLGSWQSYSPSQFLRLIVIPLQGLLESVLVALVLVPVFRRTLGVSAVPVLLVSGLAAGLWDLGSGFIDRDRWRDHFLVNAIELFDTLILPLVLAAAVTRLPRARWPGGVVFQRLHALWMGRSPVWVSLLVVYLPALVCAWWMGYLYFNSEDTFSSKSQWTLARTFYWLTLLTMLYIASVITWRALSKTNKPRFKLHRIGQALILLIAAPFLVVTLLDAGFTIGQALSHSFKSTLGGTYHVNVDQDNHEILLSGIIDYGLADQLAAVIRDNPTIHRIRLSSDGGMMDEAGAGARLLSKHHFDTVVSGECSSACTILFVAGHNRTLEANGKLGFHAARGSDPNQSTTAAWHYAFAPYGIAPEFITKVTDVSRTDMWFPTRKELLDAHVLLHIP